MIKLDRVSKTYFLGDEEVRAVDDVSLEIKKKEYVSILGPSGCGKSTMMHLIGLLEVPSSGKLLLEGKDVSRLSDDDLSEIRNRKVGFVFQSFNLINKFTIWENVLMPTRYARSSIDFNVEKNAEDLLKRFGIWERRNFYPNKVSGGQQQRAAVARALIMKPSVILADEPTGNLDTASGDEIMDLLASLNKELGVTIVVVTHELEIAEKTRRRIYMRDGKVVKETK
ncbi:ABC transporter ATP-binding protein [Candidatus Chazhemtobacterium aquaticus]|jgi:ABC-type lipoprotein export system ATPase subunit|uniref:ABC-type antimicrobial peptide transport system, ATPase component n=1 Tax=Candidatus Chazhemtobacterium aquaticus TaxID=2715735 RepID=A0A857N585_9BACT|nr:ABC transporter ATP-binding protein [Candidatus Chazhemtobacterium aquaticus]QHO63405.1 ABC-type antimicrobial peptide transport system, ATPase component [Candidatus Chazhemtobacterium aquaticus]